MIDRNLPYRFLRGQPLKLAKTAIDKAWKETISHHEVQSYTANQGTEWNFIVELAPWMGSICLPQKSPRATFCQFCSHFALSLLDKILTPLKGRNKGKKNWSAGSLFPIPFFLPVSPGGSTAKTIRNSHK